MPTIVAALVPLNPSSLIAAASDSHRRNYDNVRSARLREQGHDVKHYWRAEPRASRSGFEVFGLDFVEEVTELVEQRLILRFVVGQVICRDQSDLFEQCLLG